MIIYSEEKNFAEDEIIALFSSVGWDCDARLPDLYDCLMNSPTVITARDGSRLVGLGRAVDDGCVAAFLHFILVDPEYQGRHIGEEIVHRICKKYESFPYVQVVPSDGSKAPFYEKCGFAVMDGAVPLSVPKTW